MSLFSGTVTINNSSSLYRIKITNSALASTELKDVLIVFNYGCDTKNAPSGSIPGTWYNLMDNTAINVTGTWQQLLYNLVNLKSMVTKRHLWQ
jgi:hypothetical protein